MVARLQAAIRDALKTKEVQEGFAKQAVEPAVATPAEFARRIKEETVEWAAVVGASGFKADE